MLRGAHEENWTQSTGFGSGCLASGPAGERTLLSRCYPSRRLRPPSLPAALLQAPFCSRSLSRLYNVGVGRRSWESGIPCSPRSSQGKSSLAVSSLGPPRLLWGRGGKEVLEKALARSDAKPQGLWQRWQQLQESFPSLSRQGQDLWFIFPQQLEAGLPSAEGFAPSSPPQPLEGAQMDKSKPRGDAATSEVGERGHGLTPLVKTMQSSQQKDFSIKTKQQQRLSYAGRLPRFSSSTAVNSTQPPPQQRQTLLNQLPNSFCRFRFNSSATKNLRKPLPA